MRKSRIFLAVAAVLAAMTVAFVSCAHNDDEKETSVQLSFRMMRALVDDETIEEEETGYTLTASIDGKEKDEQTKPVQIGKETAIEFKDVRANSKIRVHLRLRNLENETIYFGDSAEIIVKPGENNVSVTMHSSTIYVSEDGSDEKSGSSKESAMKTLESAFKKMSEISNDDIDWTIYVSGKISGTSTLESVSAKSVTITAKGDSAILDGGKETKDSATGSVLAIAENIEFPVTVSGITMQNGQSRIGAGFDMAGKGTATLIECTITDNEAINDGDKKANGGGIRVVNGSLVLKNTKVNNNKSEYNAGGIHFNGKELTMDDGSEVSGNTAIYSAGGVCVNNGVFTMIDGKISGNTAECTVIDKEDGTGETKTQGGIAGGLNVTRGRFVMSGGEISDNSAFRGGGIYQNRGEIEITGGKICNNKTTSTTIQKLNNGTLEDSLDGGQGGAIYINAKETDTDSSGNEFDCGNTTVVMSGGEISGNSADQQGGGINVNGERGILTLKGGTIKENTTQKEGAGVYVKNGTFSMTGGEILSNTATNGGGGVFISENKGTFTMSGGKISGNIAETKAGGGIDNKRGTLVLSGKITISDNETPSSSTKGSQIAVEKDAKSATFTSEKYGTLEFNFGASAAYLNTNIIDGVFESESEEVQGVFKSNDDDEEDTGSTSTYTRNTTTWSEDDFIEAFTAAATATDPDATEFKLQGNVTLTKNFISSNYGDADAYVTINGQGKYGIEIQSSLASFKNVTFNNGAGSRVSGDKYQAFGMIYWNGCDGMLTFDSCSFSDSKTEGDVGGGALALFGNGSVTISACTFSRNSADHGAAIDIGGADTVTITGCYFSENTDSMGCDIYLGGSGATVSGSGNISDFANPYKYYDDSKACDDLFSTKGSRGGTGSSGSAGTYWDNLNGLPEPVLFVNYNGTEYKSTDSANALTVTADGKSITFANKYLGNDDEWHYYAGMIFDCEYDDTAIPTDAVKWYLNDSQIFQAQVDGTITLTIGETDYSNGGTGVGAAELKTGENTIKVEATYNGNTKTAEMTFIVN